MTGDQTTPALLNIIAGAERDDENAPHYCVGSTSAGNILHDLDAAGYVIVRKTTPADAAEAVGHIYSLVRKGTHEGDEEARAFLLATLASKQEADR